VGALAPLLVLVFWIGFQPQPFLRVMEASVQHLLALSAGGFAPSPLAHN
jgi:NADH:ubiquinone oxidoreductase subunit 4 (subunit M)